MQEECSRKIANKMIDRKVFQFQFILFVKLFENFHTSANNVFYLFYHIHSIP